MKSAGWQRNYQRSSVPPHSDLSCLLHRLHHRTRLWCTELCQCEQRRCRRCILHITRHFLCRQTHYLSAAATPTCIRTRLSVTCCAAVHSVSPHERMRLSVFICHQQPSQSLRTLSKRNSWVCDGPSSQWQVSSTHRPLPQHSSSRWFSNVHLGQLILLSVARSSSLGVARYRRVSLLVVIASVAFSSDLSFARRMAALQLSRKRSTAPAVDWFTLSVNYITQRIILTLGRHRKLSMRSTILPVSQMILTALQIQYSWLAYIVLDWCCQTQNTKDLNSLIHLQGKDRSRWHAWPEI